eukprot:scaffold1834_cov175-Amphora_coffeaeformis.AAC.8
MSDPFSCLDAVPPSTLLPPLDASALPLPAIPIPTHVTNLAACAAHQIELLTQKDNLTIDEEDAIDDGFFLCDLRIVWHKLHIWRRLFPDIKPFFALKCHPDPMIASVLGQSRAAGFDCASLAEIELALSSTKDDTRRVIYANPQRAEGALEQALQLGVRVLTFDGAEELRKVHRIYHQQKEKAMKQHNNNDELQMVLRILVPDEHSSIPLGEKFGAPPDQWVSLIQLAVELDLPVVGVSFHCGSGNHDPASYVQAIRLAKEALDTIAKVQPLSTPKPFLLDIGGGFPGFDGHGGDEQRFCHRDELDPEPANTSLELSAVGHGKEHESTAQIAKAVTPLLRELFRNDNQMKFVAEPGRYFVEAAFAFCSRIYKVSHEVKEVDGAPHYHYYIAQGVQGVFKDTVLCGETFTPQALCMESTIWNDTPEVFASTVHGPSGEDYDLVCPNIDLPQLQNGGIYIEYCVAQRTTSRPLCLLARERTTMQALHFLDCLEWHHTIRSGMAPYDVDTGLGHIGSTHVKDYDRYNIAP